MRRVVFEDVSYSYPKERDSGASRRVFYDLSIALEPGEIYVLTGPNGCGKSTFARLMSGIICPDEGRVMIGGVNLKGMRLPEVGRAVGYVMQDPSRQLIKRRPVDEVAFGLIHNGMSKEAAMALSESTLKDYGLDEAAGTITHRLSKGEQVRLAMASVAALNPDWLILDESLSSLDPRSGGIVTEMASCLKHQGRGVLIISHSARLADEIGGRKIAMDEEGYALVG